MRTAGIRRDPGPDPFIIMAWASALGVAALCWGFVFELGRNLATVVWLYVQGMHFNAIAVVLMALMAVVLVEKGRT